MPESQPKQREMLPLEGILTRDQLIVQGLSLYCRGQRDHPVARFFAADDILKQKIHEVQSSYTPPRSLPSESAMQLVLFAA